MFDASDAVREASADGAHPFHGDEQRRAGLEGNLDSGMDLLPASGAPVLRELRGEQLDQRGNIPAIGWSDLCDGFTPCQAVYPGRGVRSRGAGDERYGVTFRRAGRS
jgi:hypothetical protein